MSRTPRLTQTIPCLTILLGVGAVVTFGAIGAFEQLALMEMFRKLQKCGAITIDYGRLRESGYNQFAAIANDDWSSIAMVWSRSIATMATVGMVLGVITVILGVLMAFQVRRAQAVLRSRDGEGQSGERR